MVDESLGSGRLEESRITEVEEPANKHKQSVSYDQISRNSQYLTYRVSLKELYSDSFDFFNNKKMQNIPVCSYRINL